MHPNQLDNADINAPAPVPTLELVTSVGLASLGVMAMSASFIHMWIDDLAAGWPLTDLRVIGLDIIRGSKAVC